MISVSDYGFLRQFLKQRSGLALTEDKQYLLESRLDPIIQSAGMSGMAQLVNALREGREAHLTDAVVEAMTTNESLFFRDKRPFDLFTSLMLPQLLARRTASQPLRIWCAAASTGQEPYSLAMLLKENERLLAGRRVDIVGTDLSSEVIARSREGVYNQFEVQRGLPVHYLLRYFTQEGQNWRVNDAIRSMVRFSTLNLLQPFGHLGSFDIVFCRNVLIYFDAATKSDVLSRLARVMSRDGFLILGGAESVLGLTTEFVPGSQQGFYVLPG
ncbi:protein-glutamate O-methyltransferase CheR [Ancylobacter dichloromethanicus]|uniref:protein-glutamate O-methyltransferase n=1 Tax=Ancylobacter dichloromethanicus TaxID=518825 RepID=A0A9W6J3N4_9HYPH|nr:protein-glutamate O-methyltransferase CheR [Ancylobacter dichloromethanicus]MBS7556333.1 protein-glutamate O-methyltransferase CheR [Ancylobacter dichloromethanicus]GLK70097.1 chemotaxis protein methyltransferase [Ancylobacter dichloromethanicus]